MEWNGLNVGELKRLLKVVEWYASDVHIKATPKGWHIQAVDPTHVGMLLMDIPMNGDGQGDLYVDLDRMIDRLRVMDANEPIHIEVEGKAMHLHAGNLEMAMPLLEPVNDAIKEPKLYFSAKAKVRMSELQMVLRAVWIMHEGEHPIADPQNHPFEVSVENTDLKIHAETDNGDEVQMLFDGAVIDGESERARYSAHYLRLLFNMKSEFAELKFGTDYPMRVDVSEPGGAQATLLLAPLIEGGV